MPARFLALLALILAVPLTSAAAPLPGPIFPRRIDATGFPLPDEAVRRLGTPTPSPYWIQDLAYTRDGKSVVACGFGVQLIDVATGRLRWSATGFNPSWPRLAVSRDGASVWVIGQKYHATANQYSLEIARFAVADGRELSRVSVPNVQADHLRLEVSASGRVVCPDGKGGMSVFDGATGRVVARASDFSPVSPNHYTISPDGTKVALLEAGGEPGRAATTYSIRVADIDARKTLHQFATANTFHLRFSPDGQTLYALVVPGNVCPRPAVVQSWDIKTGNGRAAFSAVSDRHGCDVPTRFTLSPDGKRLATTGWSSEFAVHDTADGRVVSRTCSLVGKVVAFSPDAKTLVAGTTPLTFWNPETGQLRSDSPRTVVSQFNRGLRFTGQGRLLGLAGYYDDVIEWDIATGREVARRDWAAGYPRGDYGPGSWANRQGHPVVTRSPAGRIATCVVRPDKPDDPDHGALLVTDGATGRLVRRLPPPAGFGDEVVFSDDDRYLITMNWRTAIVWDLATGKEAYRPKLNDESAGSSQGAPKVHLCPDGRHVAIHDLNATEDGGRWSVGVFELATGKEVRRFRGPGLLYRLAWSGDGRRFAMLGTKLFVGDLASDRMPLDGSADGDWYGLGISPDGRTVATSAEGGAIRLREVATGQVRHTFVGHRSMSSALQFSPDGRLLASDGPEGPVFLWDVRGELTAPKSPPDAAALERAWAALGGDDAKVAFRAIRELAEHPQASVPFLAKKVDAVPRPRTERIPALIKELGDDAFAVRERAEKELRELGEVAHAALEGALRDPSAEVRSRAKRVLDAPPRMTPERLRAVRCVEAVGWMETREAKLQLAKWAAGDYPHGLSAEARSTRAGSVSK